MKELDLDNTRELEDAIITAIYSGMSPSVHQRAGPVALKLYFGQLDLYLRTILVLIVGRGPGRQYKAMTTTATEITVIHCTS